MRRIVNRLFLGISGGPLRAYSIVTHTGRASGMEYRNPVTAYPLGDGFVIPVLYGRKSQWVRNTMANGGFTLRTKGHDHRLDRPEFINVDDALAAFPSWQQFILRRRQARDFLWAHRVTR